MLSLPLINDFDLTSPWPDLPRHTVPTTTGEPGHPTRFRIAWSVTGIYVGFECHDDRRITTGLPDGGDLWDEDVVEAFFWPDESRPVYLEYELSPAGSELLLLVPNHRGQFMGWSPWHFKGDRRTRKAVRPMDGENWAADFFIPFSLFKGLCDIRPTPGTVWRANFCRIDHDRGSPQLYSWSPGIKQTFHDPALFGRVRFE